MQCFLICAKTSSSSWGIPQETAETQAAAGWLAVPGRQDIEGNGRAGQGERTWWGEQASASAGLLLWLLCCPAVIRALERNSPHPRSFLHRDAGPTGEVELIPLWTTVGWEIALFEPFFTKLVKDISAETRAASEGSSLRTPTCMYFMGPVMIFILSLFYLWGFALMLLKFPCLPSSLHLKGNWSF